MRVLVACAAVGTGRLLIPRLLEAGHEVVGMTRRHDKAGALAALGARGIVVDALDREAVRPAGLAAAPPAGGRPPPPPPPGKQPRDPPPLPPPPRGGSERTPPP